MLCSEGDLGPHCPLLFSVGLRGELYSSIDNGIFFLSSPHSKFRAFGRPESQQAHSSSLVNKKEILEPREERNKVAVVNTLPSQQEHSAAGVIKAQGPVRCSAP